MNITLVIKRSERFFSHLEEAFLISGRDFVSYPYAYTFSRIRVKKKKKKFFAAGVPREEMRAAAEGYEEGEGGEALETPAVPGERRLSVSISRPLISLWGSSTRALWWKGVYKLGLNCFTTIVCTDLFDKTRTPQPEERVE